MNPRTVRLIVVALVVCSTAAMAATPGRNIGFVTEKASDAPALQIALDYLRSTEGLGMKAGLSAADLEDLAITDNYVSQHNGTTHVYLRQRLHGLEVMGSETNINVARDGRIINIGNRLVPSLKALAPPPEPALSAGEAVFAAARGLGLEMPDRLLQGKALAGPERQTSFAASDLSLSEIPARLIYHARDGVVRLAWDLVIEPVAQDHLWNLFVDAETGVILAKHDWMTWDSYDVYAIPKESPLDGPQTLELDPADSTFSPFGWHDTDGQAGAEFTTTRGNNVCAQSDRDGNNSSCGADFQPDCGTSLDCNFPIDLTLQPVDYQAGAVTNLFYWNNIMHDFLAHYGFDEASGNFQETNYSGQGSGNDSVNADAQDGSGTNNANFSTPPEGGPFNPHPRMQMFEWTPPFVNELAVDGGGTFFGSEAAFGPTFDITGVSGAIVLVDDGTGTTTDGCESIAAMSGIALIDRGSCSFTAKVLNAQAAGASAVVVVNNVAGNPITLGDDGNGGGVTIPSMMISLADGDTVKAGLPSNGTARQSPAPPPNRDSDLDNGVIAHEYCHGLSIRLTGGPGTSNCLSGNQQAGEGWSDLCALFISAKATDADVTPRGVGGYLIFDSTEGAGIRNFPYSTDLAVNPFTYGELLNAGSTLSVPHGVGTVWATAVWEMYWALTNDQGFDSNLFSGTGGNNVAIQLVVDGLKLQPCDPTFLDARDAILLADQNNNGGANQCLIWQAFAKRGMGLSADDGGSSSSTSVTEAFDVPAECVNPNVCGNGICEDTNGEDCNTCPSDCISGTSSGAICGNGICEAGDGEDCVSCPADCNGVQSGKPSGRFCCGDGDGDGAISCSDSRCTSSGFSCTDTPSPSTSFCCGDLVCEGDESCGNCGVDCNLGAELCSGGVDEDCDGAVDCADADCATAPECQQTGCDNDGVCEPGEDCNNCSNDCDGVTGGKPSGRFCCGDGTLDGPEGDGSICDGNP